MKFLRNVSLRAGLLAGLLFSLSFFSLHLSATQWTKMYGLEAYVGPEIYEMRRAKEGGAEQSGILYGVRGGYDRIQRSSFYWGIDALWAQGVLKGKVTGSDGGESWTNPLKSTFTDSNVEARVGYTFQSESWRCASFTPYTGGGYFWENNFYQHPSPLPIHFKNRFSYIPIGFLSQIFITPTWSVGLNCKVRYLLDGSQEVSHDPDHENMNQHYVKHLQYRGELPIIYFFCWKRSSLAVSLVPFYEYRSFGHMPNFPFDFLETKLNLYGATLKLFYLF